MNSDKKQFGVPKTRSTETYLIKDFYQESFDFKKKITQKFAHPQLANPVPNLIRNPEQIFYVMRKAYLSPGS